MTTEPMRAAALKPEDWAPEKIWLQYGQGEGGSHTWCEDSQAPDCDEAEYSRVDVVAAALAAARAEGRREGLLDAAKFCRDRACKEGTLGRMSALQDCADGLRALATKEKE